MSVSTKTGDSGLTGTARGERVPKYHLITEAVGAVDEANSFVGLARSLTAERKTKRLLLQVQKHLFVAGAEISGGVRSKKNLRETDVRWLETLVEEFEEALSLPPGFVAFGQERTSSQLDVARAAIRRAERLVVRMKSEGLVNNPFLLKYLNRLSDLLFVLACYSEETEAERRRIAKAVSAWLLSGPASRRRALAMMSIIAVLIVAIASLLLFHGNPEDAGAPSLRDHVQSMESMHR